MTLPRWADWAAEGSPTDYTLGVEEEIMLLDPEGWPLAHEIDRVLPALEPELGSHVTAETHKSALELRSRVHRTVPGAAAELGDLRAGARRPAAHAGPARGGQRHPSVRGLAGGSGVHRPPLPARVQLDARAGAPRADLRAPRARGRGLAGATRSSS